MRHPTTTTATNATARATYWMEHALAETQEMLNRLNEEPNRWVFL